MTQSHRSDNIIEKMKSEHDAVIQRLADSRDTSLQLSTQAVLSKSLVISVASYFEKLITDEIVEVFHEATSQSDVLTEFVRRKAISRRYHEWFDWKNRSANSFFNSFGPDSKVFFQDRIDKLNDSLRAFLELGDLRNRLAHENFATFPLDKTLEEIFVLYGEANRFVGQFPDVMRKYVKESQREEVRV